MFCADPLKDVFIHPALNAARRISAKNIDIDRHDFALLGHGVFWHSAGLPRQLTVIQTVRSQRL